MSTVREHLRKAHESMAEDHNVMADCHEAALGKAKESAMSGEAAFHKDMAAAHRAAADKHLSAMEQCAKAIASDMSKIIPTDVSVVTPTPAGVTAVPRAGQQPISATVEVDFSKLLGLSPEDMHVEERSLRR